MAASRALAFERRFPAGQIGGPAPGGAYVVGRRADDFAEADKAAKEVVLARGKLDSLLKNTKKSYVKFGGLMSQEDQANAESIFLEAEAAGRSDKVDDITRAMLRLERVAMQLTAAMLNASDAVGSES